MQGLSGPDASFLYLERSSRLLHACGLVVVDSTTMPGGYAFHKPADELVTQLNVVPAFRRRLPAVPLDLDHPVRVEDHDFDIGNHVRPGCSPPCAPLWTVRRSGCRPSPPETGPVRSTTRPSARHAAGLGPVRGADHVRGGRPAVLVPAAGRVASSAVPDALRDLLEAAAGR
ncbi:MAG TPA: wax ester/triacylglycerol synthase domain-containing protein [Actinophytocola sp.]|uniref:wax ester/triacylglycerol synthase domain-containing protein n=1 Tax=Actinophytocola sp. TaxID=1872138 RepID=UPI002DDD64C1|nr:wax ester/triacylglycerol synthase domain-containing protein [Actinophytocola sp.]HEV2781739.1 wax ester/triacylglycerol synthase domain-containing protein [Actinophytocola sp.]